MPGKCLGCGCDIETFWNMPAWCTDCAGFTSPVQKEQLDKAAGAAVGAAAGLAAGDAGSCVGSAATSFFEGKK